MGAIQSKDDLIDGLWKNARDSIRHALDHFGERGSASVEGRPHHDKWIVLSVHHAAECVCNMRLLMLGADGSKFKENKFPALSRSLELLKGSKFAQQLCGSEICLFKLLDKLAPLRHQFMHRTVPENADASIAAMCMIGLLRVVEQLRGETASDIVWQCPPIERDVVAAIRYTRLDEYSRFVETLLREQHEGQSFSECPYCGALAAIGSSCKACFEDLHKFRCPCCFEEVYYAELPNGQMIAPSECPHCGASVDV